MTTRRLLTFCIIAAALAVPAAALAGSFNHVGRYLGWGWSNGYHSQNSWMPPQTNWRGRTVVPNPSYPGPNYGPRAVREFGPTLPMYPNSSEPVLPSQGARPQVVPLRQ